MCRFQTLFIISVVIIPPSLSGIFIYKNNQLITPKLTNQILAGTTRRQIIYKIASKLNIEIVERDIKLSEITDSNQFNQIDEIWLTSSTKLIWNVSAVNRQNIKSNNQTKLAQTFLNQMLEMINTSEI